MKNITCIVHINKPTCNVLVANSTPIVDLDSKQNSFLVNLESMLDFPTPESPINTTLKRQSYSWSTLYAMQVKRWNVKSKLGLRLEGFKIQTLVQVLQRSEEQGTGREREERAHYKANNVSRNKINGRERNLI